MTKTLVNGSTIGKAKVVVDIVKKGNPEIRPTTAMKPLYVTYHNTGNKGKGANAKSHNIYIHNLAGKPIKDTTHVSWHLTVDENFIYQHIPFDEMAWHCGDGAKGSGNAKSIGIEICMHVDQKNYAQAEANALALAVVLMQMFNIKPAAVHPHQHWSGKYCPQVILSRDGTFAKVRAQIDAAYQIATTKKPKEEVKVTTPVANTIARDTFRKEAIAEIKAALKDGRFSSGHEGVATYTDTELQHYMLIALARRK